MGRKMKGSYQNCGCYNILLQEETYFRTQTKQKKCGQIHNNIFSTIYRSDTSFVLKYHIFCFYPGPKIKPSELFH